MAHVTLSIGIQTHPARADMAAALQERIDGSELVVDPAPDGFRSPWRTYRHALETTPVDATHRLVIQDDTVVCDSFAEVALRAVTARPDRVVVFFVGGNPREFARAVMQACSRDLAWAELDNKRWLPVVATCWPVDMIPRMLTFVDAQRWPERFRADDEITGRFLRHSGIVPCATVPSLVEHPDMTPSLVGRRHAGGADVGRIAACFIGDCDECDPLEMEWA